MGILAIQSDNLVNLVGLYDSVSAAYVNNATVTGSLMHGATVVYSFSLSYIAASNGNYTGAIPSSVTTGLNADRYTIEVTATQGGFTLVLAQDQIAELAQG